MLQIRDHFLHLSQKFSEDLENQKKTKEEKPIQEDRKRKREYNNETTDYSIIEVPALKMKMRGPKNKGQKRRFNEIDRQAANPANINQTGNDQPNPKRKRRNKFKNKQHLDPNIEAQMNKSLNQQQNSNKKKQRPKNFYNQKVQPFNKRNNQEKQFVPYDYASVDFRQFQGGAGSATGAVEIKQKFKGKVRI